MSIIYKTLNPKDECKWVTHGLEKLHEFIYHSVRKEGEMQYTSDKDEIVVVTPYCKLYSTYYPSKTFFDSSEVKKIRAINYGIKGQELVFSGNISYQDIFDDYTKKKYYKMSRKNFNTGNFLLRYEDKYFNLCLINVIVRTIRLFPRIYPTDIYRDSVGNYYLKITGGCGEAIIYEAFVVPEDETVVDILEYIKDDYEKKPPKPKRIYVKKSRKKRKNEPKRIDK